jgi:hypothetical protein
VTSLPPPGTRGGYWSLPVSSSFSCRVLPQRTMSGNNLRIIFQIPDAGASTLCSLTIGASTKALRVAVRRSGSPPTPREIPGTSPVRCMAAAADAHEVRRTCHSPTACGRWHLNEPEAARRLGPSRYESGIPGYRRQVWASVCRAGRHEDDAGSVVSPFGARSHGLARKLPATGGWRRSTNRYGATGPRRSTRACPRTWSGSCGRIVRWAGIKATTSSLPIRGCGSGQRNTAETDYASAGLQVGPAELSLPQSTPIRHRFTDPYRTPRRE